MNLGFHNVHGIYFAIEQDLYDEKYSSYFVHNNIFSDQKRLDIEVAKSIREENDGLYLNHIKVDKNKELLYWEYDVHASDLEELYQKTVSAIDAIRSWETGKN
ncbi:hypothetical protein AB2B38_007670 [Balneola sp. MJW-20]|uniref:hypothetical protein n=1 Tax=Gracilimonas aurantiaca TaxID=3234185 RepID=UPI0034657BCC